MVSRQLARRAIAVSIALRIALRSANLWTRRLANAGAAKVTVGGVVTPPSGIQAYNFNVGQTAETSLAYGNASTIPLGNVVTVSVPANSPPISYPI